MTGPTWDEVQDGDRIRVVIEGVVHCRYEGRGGLWVDIHGPGAQGGMAHVCATYAALEAVETE